MADSETQPLLTRPQQQRSHREKTAELLESRSLHQFVLLLITIGMFGYMAQIPYLMLVQMQHAYLLTWVTRFSMRAALQSKGPVSRAEIPLTLWSLGPRFYFPGAVPHAALHLFDAFIIIVTFVLEVVLRGKEQELAGLLVVLRLWRLIKLAVSGQNFSLLSLNESKTGVSVGVGEVGEADAIRAAEAEQRVEELEKENSELKARLAEAGIQ
ncbi:hypothetical protein MIND_01040400 [Mycena indigotica]|uniref:Voltage-gated hydrogen channel 1 n=1 Tax=Mycena indigotica TaxID=2126181 RepID=A0A8H6VYL4_9AGAR|nr:uncharacterized protein MIND_01040400 [Mycena indigotica]KAF7295023.1 hypothetical protein MIND_01040400 [Mycena indigotica]